MKKNQDIMLLPRRRFLAALGCVFAGGGYLFSSVRAFADVAFARQIQEFRKTALQQGIRSEVFDLAFAGIDAPDPRVLELAARQPEFRNEAWLYFDNRVEEEAVREGQILAGQYKQWLDRIEKRFGVRRNILLAIWSLETNYGAALKRDERLHDAITALATLGFAGGKRARFGRQQLIAALKILQNGDIDRHQMRSSWAGAMGHTQFIPTSYLHYSVDMDGDGRRDIWNSIPDALASSASLLQRNGWKSGRDWGYEVILPPDKARKFPAGSLSIAEWQKLGLKRVRNRPFPDRQEQATLKLPDGRAGPVFLVVDNFFCIKRYNNADRYAFAVGLLGDRIGGGSGLVQDWSRPFVAVSVAERREIQQHLAAYGFYQGRIDGKIGSASIKAIEAFQRHQGSKVDGYPGRQLLQALRAGKR